MRCELDVIEVDGHGTKYTQDDVTVVVQSHPDDPFKVVLVVNQSRVTLSASQLRRAIDAVAPRSREG